MAARPPASNSTPAPKAVPASYDWKSARTVSLKSVYKTAQSLKNSVYRRWIKHLSMLAMRLSDQYAREEALRRIEYIEENLIKGEDDEEYEVYSPAKGAWPVVIEGQFGASRW